MAKADIYDQICTEQHFVPLSHQLPPLTLCVRDNFSHDDMVRWAQTVLGWVNAN